MMKSLFILIFILFISIMGSLLINMLMFDYSSESPFYFTLMMFFYTIGMMWLYSFTNELDLLPYMMFLIFISGLLVVFVYFSYLMMHENMYFQIKTLLKSTINNFLISSFMILSISLNMNKLMWFGNSYELHSLFIQSNLINSLDYIFYYSSNSYLIFCLLYLLICLICVIKISITMKENLRIMY